MLVPCTSSSLLIALPFGLVPGMHINALAPPSASTQGAMRIRHRAPRLYPCWTQLSCIIIAARRGRDGRHRAGAKVMSGDDKVEVSKGGLALAQHIAPVYGDNPKVRVVM